MAHFFYHNIIMILCYNNYIIILFSQNHVAEVCTNQYIPDNGNYVYVSGKNPSSDPTFSAWKTHEVRYYKRSV